MTNDPTIGAPLTGRVALVTGAARGQGRAHCEALAAAGCDIIATDICSDIPTIEYPLARPEDLDATAEAVRASGRRCHTAVADVRDLVAMAAAVDTGVAALGGLDFAVCNAGVSAPVTRSWERSEAEWDATVDTNFKGTWITTKVAVPHILDTGRGGSIVIISSMVGLTGAANTTSYMASKWAVRGLAKSLSGEVGPMGIRVNSIHPGNVRTPMIDNSAMISLMSGGEASDLDGAAAGFGALNVLPRPWVEPTEISAMVVHLCSPAGAGITGAEIAIDLGGSSKFG
ncbi:mycofactocin-coupled SDR family oxidoreductase [Dietzia sp. NPDC055340]